MRRLGILQCGRAPEVVSANHGEYLKWFGALLAPHGFVLEAWDVENLSFPSSPDAADAWLITGSKHGAYEDHAFVAPLEAFIRDVHAAKAPLGGICFGHQIIATALGGRVEKFEGGWNFGRQRYAVDGLGEVYLNACHQDQVLDLPDGAQVIASNDGCRFAGFRIGDHCVTLQPHPEIDPAILADYVVHFRGLGKLETAMVDAAEAMLHLPSSELAVGAWLADALKVRQPSCA
jgi:GMP synthase (glutamine-hydrolysing)